MRENEIIDLIIIKTALRQYRLYCGRHLRINKNNNNSCMYYETRILNIERILKELDNYETVCNKKNID